MGPHLQILGSSAAWPEPGRACSGVLVTADDHHLVIDLGYGAYSRLLRVLPDAPSEVDAVLVTHAHPDHLVDVHALYRARKWGTRSGRLPLLATPQVATTLAALDPEGTAGVDDVFDLVSAASGPVRLGPWRVRGVEVPHYLPNTAYRLDSDAGSVAVTGDTGWSPGLVELVAGVDLLVCEATDRGQRDPTWVPDGLLLTGEEAGELARRAEVGRLLLNHFWPGNDREQTRRAAAGRFGGPVVCADEDAPPIPLA